MKPKHTFDLSAGTAVFNTVLRDDFCKKSLRRVSIDSASTIQNFRWEAKALRLEQLSNAYRRLEYSRIGVARKIILLSYLGELSLFS